MGPRKHPHPLELFRNSETGFQDATTRPEERRTLPGKVLASTVRGAAVAQARPARPRARSSAVGNRLLVSTLGVIGLLVVFVMVVDALTSDDGGARTPALKRDAPGRPVLAAEWFGILAATYPGSPTGEERALDAETGLKMRGFGDDVMVLGFPDPARPGTFLRYSLLVGQARDQTELKDTLASLRAIADWETGRRSPFRDARIVKHPLSY